MTWISTILVKYELLIGSPLTSPADRPPQRAAPSGSIETLDPIFQCLPQSSVLALSLIARCFYSSTRHKAKIGIALEESDYQNFRPHVLRLYPPFAECVETLTCYGFSPKSIPADGSPISPIISEIVRFLHLLPRVNHLKFSDALSYIMQHTAPNPYDPHPLWKGFFHIQSLSLSRVVLLHVKEFMGIIAALPSLRALELERVAWHVTGDVDVQQTWRSISPPRLQRLKISGVLDDVVDEICTWFEFHPNLSKDLWSIDVECCLHEQPIYPILRAFSFHTRYLHLAYRTLFGKSIYIPQPELQPLTHSHAHLAVIPDFYVFKDIEVVDLTQETLHTGPEAYIEQAGLLLRSIRRVVDDDPWVAILSLDIILKPEQFAFASFLRDIGRARSFGLQQIHWTESSSRAKDQEGTPPNDILGNRLRGSFFSYLSPEVYQARWRSRYSIP